MEMILYGELEENEVTLAMATAELDQPGLVPRQGLTENNFPWIEAEKEQKRDVVPDSFPWIEAEEEQKRDVVSLDLDVEKRDEVTEDDEGNSVIREDEEESFPWIR